MSLSTGASLITLSLLLNKLSGLYGILALFTGYHLSPVQLSMYIYSILALILTVYLTPHIRTQSPLHCLALAWFYVLDSLVNAVYTAAFAVTWFLVLAQHNAGKLPANTSTAGFNESQVDTVDSAIPSDQDTTAVDTPASTTAGADGTLSTAVLTNESLNSIGFIIALWTLRLYFCLIMLAYARLVLRQHIVASTRSPANSTTDYTAASTSSTLVSNPFDANKPAGQGWRGKLGRAMLSVVPSYWLGPADNDDDAAWISATGAKFRRSADAGNKIESGPTERERRRRSGTGPPEPPPQLLSGQKTLDVPMQNL
jgi:inositol phosphorylceramide synthase regulatory subunit